MTALVRGWEETDPELSVYSGLGNQIIRVRLTAGTAGCG